MLFLPGIVIVLAVAFGTGLYLYTFWNPRKNHHIPQEYILPPEFKRNREEKERILEELKREPFEQVSIRSEDGLLLQGRYYHLADDAPFALMMHGYKSCCFCDFLMGWGMMRKLGYNMLLIDERACGLSEGSTITFGIMERKDCLSWVHYLTERFGKQISVVLYGVSMGSATVMMAAGMPELPKNVKAVIADCGYTSPREIICHVASTMKLPARFCYPFARAAAKVLGGFDPDEASAVEAVRQTALPILFIHGEKDAFVPFRMCGELYEACESEKQMLTVPEAVHANSIMTDPERYAQTVELFLAKHVCR